jgi:hypothetical protein
MAGPTPSAFCFSILMRIQDLEQEAAKVAEKAVGKDPSAFSLLSPLAPVQILHID